MYEARKAMLGAMLGVGLLAGCESTPVVGPPPPLEIVPEIQDVQVACVEVNGFPAFTDEACREYAEHVKNGLQEFSHLTGNVIPPPNVVPKHYTKPLSIDTARERRCLRVDGDRPENQQKTAQLITDISSAAISQAVDIDFNHSLLYVTANAPTSMCQQAGPKPVSPGHAEHTERCTVEDGRAGFEGGHAMLTFDRPVIITFTTPNVTLLEQTVAHERGHWGRGKTRLGHEYVLCDKKQDQVPAVIHNSEPDLGFDIEGDRGSLMSYSEAGGYLAAPQLAYLGVIPQDRVMNANGPGEFQLSEVPQQNVVQLPLTNLAIKALIRANSSVNPDDYSLWLGKIPDRTGVGVYAAPQISKHTLDTRLIFLLDIVTPDHPFTIEGDATIANVRDSGSSASVKVDKAIVK